MNNTKSGKKGLANNFAGRRDVSSMGNTQISLGRIQLNILSKFAVTISQTILRITIFKS